MNYKAYIKYSACCFIVILLTVAAINYVVDPYGMFGTKDIKGLNIIKPNAGDRGRIVKLHQIERYKPDILIAGNSRPEMGLDPTSGCWGQGGDSIYNMSIPGIGVYMLTRYLQHVLATQDIKHIYVGVDFIDFLVTDDAPVNYGQWPAAAMDFESRLIVDKDGRQNRYYTWVKYVDMLKALFSLQGLKDSVETVLVQNEINSGNRRMDGFNPARDYLDIIASEGQEVLFVQKNKVIIKQLSNSKANIFQDARKWSVHFESIKRLLFLAKSLNIKVTLFINPYHAEYLAAINLMGKWEMLEMWKRELVNISHNIQGVTLWDFNAFNLTTTERISEVNKGNKKALSWFWEPAHYKKELGEVMLSEMLSNDCLKSEKMNLGRKVNNGNIDAHLYKLNSDLQTYILSSKDVTNKLGSIINEFEKK